MNEKETEGPGDQRFVGWRDEFPCEQCRRWTGKPPIPIAQADLILREQGLKDFKLRHACHIRTAADGQVHHIPITVLETSDRRIIEWHPELPSNSR